MRLLILLFLAFAASTVNAQTYILISDALDANAAYVLIRVNDAPTADCGPESPCISDGAISYDLSTIVALGNPFQVDAAACNVLHQCSAPSVPLAIVPGAPLTPAGIRIQVLP